MTGRSLAENYASAECFDDEVIRTFDNPVKPVGSHIAVLHGNLAPHGAVIKQSAAAPELMRHRGRARVWDRVEDYLAEADRDDCDLEPDDVDRHPLQRPSRAIRACPRSATSRCPNACCNRGSGTWCGSRTPA